MCSTKIINLLKNQKKEMSTIEIVDHLVNVANRASISRSLRSLRKYAKIEGIEYRVIGPRGAFHYKIA